MCIIDRFLKKAPPGKSPWKNKIFFLVRFFSLDNIPKINICHMAAKEYHKVIEWRRLLIDVDVLYFEESAEDDSIVHGDADMDEEDMSGLVKAGVTEEVGYMQKALKSSYL